jgi:PPOX class probable F420-dependent enzyme
MALPGRGPARDARDDRRRRPATARAHLLVLSANPATGAPTLHTPLDEKPKRTTDPLALARARDIVARPHVTILVDHWAEDWTGLAWLRAQGEGVVLKPGHPAAADERATAIASLRAKYPQYADHDLASRPLIRIVVTGAVSWAAREG